MPPSLSALLQSGDHPSQQLLGRPGVTALVADIPRIAPQTPARVAQAGTPGGISRRGTAPDVLLPAMIELEGRDPFSLWVHWQVDESHVLPGHSLHLRIFAHSLEGPWMLEQSVAASGHRTLPVLYANTVYLAALGRVSNSGAWHPVAVSAPVRTAPDRPSTVWTSQSALFPSGGTGEEASTESPSPTTVPRIAMPALPDVEAATLLTTLAPEAVAWANEPNSSSSVALRTRPPSVAPEGGGPSIISPLGSLAWTAKTLPVPGSVPIPPPAPAAPPGFWFRVHAELILHGSTEPGASVTIGGHPIRLRDDGSFTFRFSLPDGAFDLPIEAVKADGSDRRAADVTVTRRTAERGDVGVHPIDPSLRPPLVKSLH